MPSPWSHLFLWVTRNKFRKVLTFVNSFFRQFHFLKKKLQLQRIENLCVVSSCTVEFVIFAKKFLLFGRVARMIFNCMRVIDRSIFTTFILKLLVVSICFQLQRRKFSFYGIIKSKKLKMTAEFSDLSPSPYSQRSVFCIEKS